MSVTRQMKKIDMETLEKAEHKVSLARFKKALVAVAIVLAVCGGGFGAYRLLTGEVWASRFTVNKMTCPACVLTVQEVTGKIPGVIRADVSLAAQDVTVEFRNKQTNPEQIKGAIAHAGYPTQVDAVFKPGSEKVDELVVALVNGRPVLGRDLKMPVEPEKGEAVKTDPASKFFSVVGKAILLQIADTKTVVVQPYEVEEEVAAIKKKQELSSEEIAAWITKNYGSTEKLNQIVAQRIGIRKLLEEHVLSGISDPKERERKTLEWVGTIFKDADVKVLDPEFREKVHAAAGSDDWKVFWPRMIGAKTELKSVLLP